jgi:flavin-binding protein dodecin
LIVGYQNVYRQSIVFAEAVTLTRVVSKWILHAANHFQIPINHERRIKMAESIYKIIELVGTSTVSWEDAAKNAVETAGKSLKDLRIADVTKMDMKIEKNKVVAYRTRVNLSFKYEQG